RPDRELGNGKRNDGARRDRPSPGGPRPRRSSRPVRVRPRARSGGRPGGGRGTRRRAGGRFDRRAGRYGARSATTGEGAFRSAVVGAFRFSEETQMAVRVGINGFGRIGRSFT